MLRTAPVLRSALAVLLLAGVALPAGATGPTSTVAELGADIVGTTVTVDGVADLVDASAAEVGTDPAGDTTRAGIGADVTAATIRKDDGSDALVFGLTIADELAATFTLPEVVHYHWYLTVTNGTRSRHYLLRAMRSGQSGRVVPNVNPMFRVFACSVQTSGNVLCGDGTVAVVPGVMESGRVEWHVPLTAIGAFPGAVVTEGPGGVLVQPGASGFAYVSGATTTFDTLATTAYVVGPAVAVGIRRALVTGVPAPLVHAAALGPDGSFVAKLRSPTIRGDYVVVARACHGAIERCGVAEVPLTVD